MRSTRYRQGLSTLLLILLIFGACVGAQSTVNVRGGKDKEAVVEMTATNFKFEPAAIQARVGDNISIEIRNTASGTHNFSLKDPKGQIIESYDLPPNQKITVKVSLREPGVYEFYCDKPFHSTMGMKGRLEVAQ